MVLRLNEQDVQYILFIYKISYFYFYIIKVN